MRTLFNIVLFIGLVLYLSMILIGGAFGASITKPVYIPPLALQYMPILKEEIATHWPVLPTSSMLAAQVETESCVSIKSKRCWNTRAELKTDREYGFGLGQITITKRFNVFEEVKASDKSLSHWQWDNRFDPRMQLRAIVIKDRNDFNRLRWAATVNDRLAMTFSAYNGGLGGLLKDRTLCSRTAKCDPTRWFGHIELTSYKSKTVVKGYGKSFYAINREYPKQIMDLQPRRAKYVPYMD